MGWLPRGAAFDDIFALIIAVTRQRFEHDFGLLIVILADVREDVIERRGDETVPDVDEPLALQLGDGALDGAVDALTGHERQIDDGEEGIPFVEVVPHEHAADRGIGEAFSDGQVIQNEEVSLGNLRLPMLHNISLSLLFCFEIEIGLLFDVDGEIRRFEGIAVIFIFDLVGGQDFFDLLLE